MIDVNVFSVVTSHLSAAFLKIRKTGRMFLTFARTPVGRLSANDSDLVTVAVYLLAAKGEN